MLHLVGGDFKNAVTRLKAPNSTETTQVLAETLDVQDSNSVSRFFAYALKMFGRVDVLINNAGIGGGGRTVDLPEAHWHEIMQTNLNGVYRCSVEYLRRARDTGLSWGRIINVASTGWQLCWIGLSAVLLMMGVVAATPAALSAWRVPPDVSALIVRYLEVSVLGLPAMIVVVALSAMLSARKLVRLVMRAHMMGAGVYLPLTWLLAIHGVPTPLGAIGLSVAVVIVQWLSAAFLLRLTLRSIPSSGASPLLALRRPEMARIKPILRIGAPLATSAWATRRASSLAR